MVPLEGGIPSARMSAIICRSSAVSGVERERFWCQIDFKRRQKGSESDQHWAKMEPKWGKELSKTLSAKQRRKRCQNVCSVLILLDDRFCLKSCTHFIENSSRNRFRKNRNICQQTGFQNVIEIDAGTHQKSMPKLVTRKIMTIIKNHVSVNAMANSILSWIVNSFANCGQNNRNWTEKAPPCAQ